MANSRKNVLLFSSREPFFICRLVGRKLFNLLRKHFICRTVEHFGCSPNNDQLDNDNFML
jgi:hypothetical protein